MERDWTDLTPEEIATTEAQNVKNEARYLGEDPDFIREMRRMARDAREGNLPPTIEPDDLDEVFGHPSTPA